MLYVKTSANSSFEEYNKNESATFAMEPLSLSLSCYTFGDNDDNFYNL